MKAMKEFYDLARELYGPFFPTSRKKKEEFLEKVREKVSYYQPRIEDRCGVCLGDVKVKDIKDWLSDTLVNSAYETAIENASKEGRAPTGRDFHEYFMIASVVRAIAIVPVWLRDFLRATDYRYGHGTIYVPFSYANRAGDVDFKKRAKELDTGVVHELAHSLWQKISGDKHGYFGEGRRWCEGFATYCEDNYFADFYPETQKKSDNLPKVYREGKKRVERVVAEHGKGILLEIPKKWKEFAEEFSQKA